MTRRSKRQHHVTAGNARRVLRVRRERAAEREVPKGPRRRRESDTWCTGQGKHTLDQRPAEVLADHLTAQWGESMSAYRCPAGCGGWHVGHTLPPLERRRIADQLILDAYDDEGSLEDGDFDDDRYSGLLLIGGDGYDLMTSQGGAARGRRWETVDVQEGLL